MEVCKILFARIVGAALQGAAEVFVISTVVQAPA